MPDIFGRTPSDYALVQALRKANQWDGYQARQAMTRPDAAPRHDFDALGSVREAAVSDAQAVGFLTNSMLAIQTFIDNVLYTRNRLNEMVQLNTAIPEGATTYGYRVRDWTGRAARITASGGDAPTATVSQTIITHPLHYYGIDALWTIDELRGAMMAGEPLDTDSIEAAIMATMNSMEELAFIGDDTNQGLVNLPTTGTDAVTRNNAARAWSAATALQIRKEINDQLSGLIEDSQETIAEFGNPTIYLPGARYDQLSDLYVGDNADRTLLRAMMDDNPFTNFTGMALQFRRLLELKNAFTTAVNGTRDRMIVTMRHPRVFEMPVSIQPRVITILDKGRNQCAQVEAKFGPIWTRRATLIRYVDGI